MLFNAYVTEADNNHEVKGLAVFDGPCHNAWQASWRGYSAEYHTYLDTYGIPPATLRDVYCSDKH